MKNVIEALKELNIEIISSSNDAILVDADNNYFDYDNEDMSIDEDVLEILEDNLCQAYFVAVNILKITKA
tara:strand:+ start:951 stop:1160 length:210 start_codon:yes stop_codon:yes gene_type:complete